MNKIKIEDLTKIRITKVKPWKIVFSYDNTVYMLLDDSDEERHLSLLKQIERDGKKTFSYINGRITIYTPMDFVKDISKRKFKNIDTFTYSNLDREHFVKKLVELGFSSGLYEAEYLRKEAEINKLRLKIKDIEKQIADTEANWRKTSGHGSKCCSDYFRRQAAERVVGAKDGEYCKEYNDYYGNTDPKYGGVLTDLFSLPVGTCFYVCNGCYDAVIGVSKHGDKTVVTAVNEVELTKEHHSAYIKKGIHMFS